LEATEARRARKTANVLGYGLALCVLIALRCDSFAHLAGRATRDASRSTRRAGVAMAQLSNAGLRTVARAMATACQQSAFRHLESEGSLVAVVLAVVAIGYGGLITIPWRYHAPTVSPSTAAVAHAATVDTTDARPVHAIVAVAPTTPDRVVDARPRVRVMNASTLNTIWRRNDTRSLQQAFAGLRGETLAFHRCSMKMTAADLAIARCDGVAGRTTFDFQRTGGRWAIRRVTNR
jgi:hypothetical protein